MKGLNSAVGASILSISARALLIPHRPEWISSCSTFLNQLPVPRPERQHTVKNLVVLQNSLSHLRCSSFTPLLR